MSDSASVSMFLSKGLTAIEQGRTVRLERAIYSVLAENWINDRAIWTVYVKGKRRMLKLSRFEIEDTEFATISDDDLLRRMRAAIC